MICRRFRIVTPITFLHIHTRYYEMFVYKHTETIQYVKVAYFLRKIEPFAA